MKRKELIKNLALEIEQQIYDFVVDSEKTEDVLHQVWIEETLIEVDFKASIEWVSGYKSFDYDVPDDPDEIEVDVYEIEVRNVWNNENLLSNVRNELNKELYKLLNK